ncbi:MAG: beta-lactamase family protein, partial [candidate division WOR-3 bacterium]
MRKVSALALAVLLLGCATMKKTFRQNPDEWIHGQVAEGFEPVRGEFTRNFTERGEIGAACCVYYHGEKVVDLWGGYRDWKPQSPWEENTVVRVFSTTKGMALLVLGKLHSDGLLDYREKVSAYWPGFAKNGKEDITVEQLVTHKAGLVLLDRGVKVSELHDFDALRELLENAKPMWEPGTKHGYQSATIGLYAQQLVQMIDPQARTIGQFFQEEIAEPLGVDFFIGIPNDFDTGRVARLKMISPIGGLFNLHKPPKGMLKHLLNPFSLFNKSFTTIKADMKDPVEELRYEEAAGGGAGEARALAKIYGILATGGNELGISPQTMEWFTRYTEPPTDGDIDVVMGIKTLGSPAGYAKPTELFDFGSRSAFGFTGSGGSFAFADPEYGLGYAYVMNKMDFYGMNDPR